LGFIKDGKSVGQLSDYYLLKKICAPWSSERVASCLLTEYAVRHRANNSAGTHITSCQMGTRVPTAGGKAARTWR